MDKDLNNISFNSNYKDYLLEKFNNDEVLDRILPDLVMINVRYYDFNNDIKNGNIICNKFISDDLLYIFEELYKNKYQIEKINLIDTYYFNDDKSMEDNNTSCFNFRKILGTNTYSNHSYGLAIDINPLYNPYCVDEDTVLPLNGVKYANRTLLFKHKIDTNDLCYKLFIERGFNWGGSWKYGDYQHFEKPSIIDKYNKA